MELRDRLVLRDRIVDFQRVMPADLRQHPFNWREHPDAQRSALKGLLEEIGIADAVLAYRSERNGGALTLIDGHLRQQEIAQPIPTLITDLTDEEADLFLATLHPVAEMAGMDVEKVDALLDQVRTNDLYVRDLLLSLQESALAAYAAGIEPDEEEKDGKDIPEMELQPFEQYNYVVLFFQRTWDWQRAVEVLGIEKKSFTLPDGYRKIGLCRVLDGAKVVEALCKSSSPQGDGATLLENVPSDSSPTL